MKRSTSRSVATRLRALLLTAGLVLAGVVGVASPASASGAPGDILPPFNTGETWYVYQGYGPNAPTHNNSDPSVASLYGLDLTYGNSTTASAGRTARAPMSGTVHSYGVDYGTLCVDTADGGSYTLTHINSSVTSGSVTAGQVVGTVGAAGSYHNNWVAHIHFQTWSAPGCWANTDGGMPFDSAHNRRICGALNLTASGDSGSNGTWSGKSFVGQSCDESTPPPTTVSGAVAPMAGHWWANDSGEDFAYVTKNSDNGFSLAIQQQTPTGLQWKGVVWTQPGSSGVQFANTLFIPVDANNDGLLDIYYATSTDWSQAGFTVGYMQNTGSGLTYGGTKQTFSSLALKDVKFLAGKWSSSGGPAFAYVTKNSDNGFSVATFSSDTSGNLTWRGVKWTQAGSSGVQFANTTFTPIDMTGDGIDELLYSSSTNPSNLGFSMGEMSNDGSNPFVWAGTKWAPTNLALAKVRFIPGYWDGPGREALAYVSQRPDNGFDLAVHGITASGGFTWQGVWYSSAVVPYVTTVFVPADTSGDGYTDMLYATASQSGAGFNMAIAYNNTNNTGLMYGSQQWDQTGLTLSRTVFLPQF